jgi:hypothetical protein
MRISFPVLNRAEEQFDTLGIRKLLGGSNDPFVTYSHRGARR